MPQNLQLGLVTSLNTPQTNHPRRGISPQVCKSRIQGRRLKCGQNGESCSLSPLPLSLSPPPVYPRVKDGTFQEVHLWRSAVTAVGIYPGGGPASEPLGEESQWAGDSLASHRREWQSFLWAPGTAEGCQAYTALSGPLFTGTLLVLEAGKVESISYIRGLCEVVQESPRRACALHKESLKGQ